MCIRCTLLKHVPQEASAEAIVVRMSVAFDFKGSQSLDSVRVCVESHVSIGRMDSRQAMVVPLYLN